MEYNMKHAQYMTIQYIIYKWWVLLRLIVTIDLGAFDVPRTLVARH